MTKNDTTRHEKALLIDFIRYQRKETKHFIRCYRIKKYRFYFVVSNKFCTFAAKSKYMEKELCLIREKVVTFRMVKLNFLLSIFLITK